MFAPWNPIALCGGAWQAGRPAVAAGVRPPAAATGADAERVGVSVPFGVTDERVRSSPLVSAPRLRINL